MSPALIGTTLGHFRITAKLGEGGMGTVWAAEDTRLRRPVALKLLAADQATLQQERFRREAETLAALRHPNIVTIFAVEEHEGRSFLVMELVEGETLRSQVVPGGLATERLLELAVPVAEALGAAHAQGIVHRDLKLENILLDAAGRPKLVDFGLATARPLAEEPISPSSGGSTPRPTPRTGSLTREGTLLGSVAYMSPEQAEGRPVDARSDVFAIGIVFYELATGERPFGGKNPVAMLSSILRDEPPGLCSVRPSAPAALEQILRRCLEKEPERRYADGGELAAALRVVRDDLVAGPTGSPAARWARSEGLPALEHLLESIQFLAEGVETWEAYQLATRIEEAIPRDPALARCWPRIVRTVDVDSDPPGALVLVRHPSRPTDAWTALGRTPLRGVRYPLGFTRIRLELAGHHAVEDLLWDRGFRDRLGFRLPAESTVPAGMEPVPEGETTLSLPGLEDLPPASLPAYWVDRSPVTHRDYRRFVAAGGYQQPRWWVELSEDAPREALARFVDLTGRPGPATWEAGDAPAGQEDHPVGGVCWYEAAAYARWADKQLPTIYHWCHLAFPMASSQVVPRANYGGQGTVPVGSTGNLHRFGAHDLAGNVREWVWNASLPSGHRFLLGGGWDDSPYSFTDPTPRSPFDRSPGNGFRCIRPMDPGADLAHLCGPIEQPCRDFAREQPVSDEVFAVLLRQFAYDRAPLRATLEAESELPGSIRQKVSFDAAYGKERMTAYLFLPKDRPPPYQTVLMFPGSDAIHFRSSEGLDLGLRENFLPRTGRAVLYPIYKGTFERGGDIHGDVPSETILYKDYLICWAKDLSRSIDYLQSRPDIEHDKIAYYGLSWGAALGAILPAVERRLRTNVLYVAGLTQQRALPEVDVVHYIGRVTQPTLMLNGELDACFPVESSQRPMFELLGTPPEHKRWVVYPGGHSVPRLEMMREMLDWLDRYLGPP